MSTAEATPRVKRHWPWQWFRRAVQLLTLVGLLVLFRLTEYRGVDAFSQPLNLIFRLDPLIALSAMLGGKTLLLSLWPAAIVLLLTLLLGRAFCGWICPLGTLLDITHRLLAPLRWIRRRLTCSSPPSNRTFPSLRPVRYIVLIVVLLGAALSLPLVGYVDPFSILYRAAVQGVDPAFARGVSAFSDADLRGTLLPFDHKIYLLAFVPVAILLIVLLLELFARRFWCRYVCPLGAGLGLVGRLAPLARLPIKQCGNCSNAKSCTSTCRMDAFASVPGKFQPEQCTLCMDCVGDCRRGMATFALRRHKPAAPAVDLSRRAVLATLAAGVALPAIAKAAPIRLTGRPDAHTLRPPGVGDHDDAFLDQCVRCGLCLKICPTNALQTQGLAGGLDGLFSPVLVPRIGYCEVNCNLCSQVCPTAAIPKLSIEQKPQAILGVAVIDRDRCLPWATKEECICCEEHCPISEKAIKVHGRWQRPHVDAKLCIGCGICENKCPVPGESAIRIVRLDMAPPDTHTYCHGGKHQE